MDEGGKLRQGHEVPLRSPRSGPVDSAKIREHTDWHVDVYPHGADRDGRLHYILLNTRLSTEDESSAASDSHD